MQGSEDYKHSNLGEWFAPNYGMNVQNFSPSVELKGLFGCFLPGLSSRICFLLNEHFVEKEQTLPHTEEGVLLGSLRDFSLSVPYLVEKYYNTSKPFPQDVIRDFNTTFVQDGFFLYVPKGVKLTSPIQLITLLKGRVDMLLPRRLLIILEDGAEASIILCHHALDNQNFLANQVTELFVGKDATLNFCELEETNSIIKHTSSTYLQQRENSRVVMNELTLLNGSSRNNYFISLEEEGAELSLSGLAIEDEKSQADIFVNVEHKVPHCSSNQLFKFVLDDFSQGSFAGKVLVKEGAEKTLAYQLNKNLCLSEGARMFTKPQLEIYAEDVKCSHGSSVGQLDEDAIFYMRSRGLSYEDAQMLLKYAFADDVLQKIDSNPLRKRLKTLVEKRFKGEMAKCASCMLRKE